MSTILVTGGAGFIGSHLCEKLLEIGHKVINIDNFNDFYDPKIKRDNIKFAQTNVDYTLVEGDIRDNEVLDKIFKQFNIDMVIHLAALAGVRKSVESPLEYIDVDIKGTVNLLEYSKSYGIKKFIFASSSSVYGLNSVPFKEDDFVSSPISPYAAAKLSGELFCRTYNNLYNIPIACLRSFTVYGPRQRPEMAIHNFTKRIDEGFEVPIFGNGMSFRDYTFIDDIIDGIVALSNLDFNFEIFNLGNSQPVQLNHLVNLIEKKIGKPAYKSYLKMQQGDVKYTYADISKAKSMLGYEPKVGIEEGVDRFIAWYKKSKKYENI